MKRWKALMLGVLTTCLVVASPAEAAEESAAAASVTAANPQAERDALRAAKAAERERLQAERAAAKAARKEAIAAGKAQRIAEKEVRTAASESVQQPTAAREVERAAATEAGNAAPAAEKAEQTARQPLATRKAERAAGKEERTATLAAAKAEKRAAAIAEREAKMAARAEKIAAHKRDRGSRYRTLLTDNGFTYYLDVQNTRWIPRPYSSSEYMIDAWVRLVENTTGEPVAEDGKIRPAKYFLEHYYISPERRQVMFLSELEVTGRPDNAVKERAYDPKNWEQLVPGSIEDELYAAITARMKSAPGQRGGILSGTSGMSLRDMIEEYARISF